MASAICCTRTTSHSHSDQLLNHIVDCLASRRPQTLYAEFPRSPTCHEEGHIKFTYGKFANAINRIAWWLHDTIGPSKDFETLAYIGPNDLRYPSLILGAVKAGYKTLLLSPRNSIVAQLHLFKVTGCKFIVTPGTRSPAVNLVIDAAGHGLSVLEIPTVEELLKPRCRAYPYDKTLEQARWDPLTVLHTSGSTGLPKPITWVQGFAPAYAKQFQLTPPESYDSVDHLYMGNRIFVVFPPFHAAYFAHALVNAICNQTTVFIPLAGVIPSAKSLSDTLRHTKLDMAFVVPTMVEELSRSPKLLEHVSGNLNVLAYSGGDVPQGCGDIVAQKVKLINFYGTTEGASIALIRKIEYDSEKDWKYASFHPDSGAEFRQHAGDIHELVIVKQLGQEHQHQIFTTFPEHDEYRTKDLYTQHKSIPNARQHVGRADDTIVFLTGEKVNPVSMEQYIFSQNAEIAGVPVAGSQRFQAVLLIELVDDTVISSSQKSQLIGKIWPSIEHVNDTCPAHARITQSHIIFTDPKKPLPRSPKGTIQRAAALKYYTEELNTLYKETGELKINAKLGSEIDHLDREGLLLSIRRATWQITRQLFGYEDNFFVNGMDSLQALLLSRDLKTTLRFASCDVDVVYGNPSISMLAQYFETSSSSSQPSTSSNAPRGSENDIDTILSTYQTLINEINQPPSLRPTHSQSKVFLLTGSTGLLGSHLLHELLCTPEIEHIYCLNRSSEASLFQAKRNTSRSLTSQFPAQRVTFLTANYSSPSFGLQSDTYITLQERVTDIIHNAWPVNFKMSLSSFLPQLDGLINFVKLAASATRLPSIMFISSISAVSEFYGATVPEAIIPDSSAPAAMGYGQSKYLSERVVFTKIARVGQIAGPVDGDGEWNQLEWFPSLVRSSMQLRAFPDSLGPNLDQIDWIPIDVLARVLVHLTGTSNGAETSSGGADVYNLLNPHCTQWKELLPVLTESLPRAKGAASMKVLTFEDWLVLVRQYIEDRQGITAEELKIALERNPAFQLLDFYREELHKGKMSWATGKTQYSCNDLQNLGHIRVEWLRKWMNGWA